MKPSTNDCVAQHNMILKVIWIILTTRISRSDLTEAHGDTVSTCSVSRTPVEYFTVCGAFLLTATQPCWRLELILLAMNEICCDTFTIAPTLPPSGCARDVPDHRVLGPICAPCFKNFDLDPNTWQQIPKRIQVQNNCLEFNRQSGWMQSCDSDQSGVCNGSRHLCLRSLRTSRKGFFSHYSYTRGPRQQRKNVFLLVFTTESIKLRL